MTTIITHGLFAAGVFRCVDRGRNPGMVGPLVAAGLCALPDIDVIWWNLTTYAAPWGHRGMTHSISFAVVVGTIAAFALRKRVRFRGGPWIGALVFTAIIASHGLFDGMTDGGKGIAFFGPFDNGRYWLPTRPVPVAPITVNPFDSGVQRVLRAEVLLFWPASWALWLAGGKAHRWQWALAVVGLLVSAYAWGAAV